MEVTGRLGPPAFWRTRLRCGPSHRVTAIARTRGVKFPRSPRIICRFEGPCSWRRQLNSGLRPKRPRTANHAHPNVINYVTPKSRVFVQARQKATVPEPDLTAYHDPALYFDVPSIREYWVLDGRDNANEPQLISTVGMGSDGLFANIRSGRHSRPDCCLGFRSSLTRESNSPLCAGPHYRFRDGSPTRKFFSSFPRSAGQRESRRSASPSSQSVAIGSNARLQRRF
jgi:hypothetical protein